MGRSTSCFKIMTCASSEKDDMEVAESKSPGDKRGWSFRKRSARHRVLNNTVISETHSSGKLESPESAAINIQPSVNSTIPEKISVKQCTDEKRELSTLMNSEPHFSTIVDSDPQSSTSVDSEPRLSTSLDCKINESTVTIEKQIEYDKELDESNIIIIQAGVRGFLGQRELLKLKNIVKLQAAVRGHLVRRHAVGTLRCVQAIVKMQALVRARRARLSLESSFTDNKSEGKDENDYRNSKTLEKENSATETKKTYTSVEKLLSNRFARQLMESTPKNKPINFKCDPSKPNSAWNWLERWMAVSSAEPTTKEELTSEQTERENNENHTSFENKNPSETPYQPADSKPGTRETVVPSESEENMITYDTGNFDFQASCQISSMRENLEQPQSEKMIPSDAKETSVDIDSLPNQTLQSEMNSRTEHNAPRNPEIESEQPKHSLETEGKKFMFGSRKASNPSFIAAQSKFEGLSSANSGKLNSPSYPGVGVESNNDTISSGADSVIREKEYSTAENSIPHKSMGQVGGSECGTELSVTSTLDSPDIYETGGVELEQEVKVSEEVACDPNTGKSEDMEAKYGLSYKISDLPAKYDDADCISETVVSQQVELMPEEGAPAIQKEPDSQTSHQAYRSSPEASPRSHFTVPESQGTPSSQVSVKAKKNRTSKSKSGQKRSSLAADNRSPSNHQDSGARSSVEQLPKDQKNGKRRNSFGSTKPDHVDQESQDNNGSLPHFMQATESARAKINSNNSPRSSPDVHDREVYIKKRHSLPGANGRQGSPHIQRSMSQAQQGAKERKWVR